MGRKQQSSERSSWKRLIWADGLSLSCTCLDNLGRGMVSGKGVVKGGVGGGAVSV